MRILMVMMFSLALVFGSVFAQSTYQSQDQGGQDQMNQGQSSQGDQGMSQGQSKTATVQSVDQAKNTLTVTKDDGSTKEYQLSKSVQVMGSDGSTKALTDLTGGTKVNLKFTGMGKNKKVSQIQMQ